MKTKKLFLYLFALVASITILWAGVPAIGTTSTGTPENGKKYYIYADTYQNGKYVPRFFYNNGGTLALSTAADESSNYYVWTCTVANGKYTFQNVGDNTKYLAHKALANAAYNFTLGQTAANHAGTTIWSDAANRYFVTKNDGSTFDQSQSSYNQTSGDWCTDYVFVEYVEPGGELLTITTNYAGAGEVSASGTALALPYTKYENTIALPITLTATANSPYTFLGFFNGEENLGTEYTIETLDADLSIEARYSLDVFSADLSNPVPVRLYNSRDKGYAIKMNSATSYTGNAVNSGNGTYGENEIWYLVGNTESFKMYSRTAGTDLAVTLAGTGSGSAATLTTTGTDLCLVAQADGSFAICPVANKDQSFNMHGGKGNNIKLYNTTDGGSKWLIKKIDTSKALKINYNAQTEGGYEQNYKIGELAINVDGNKSTSMLEKTTIPASSDAMYLPEGAVFGISKGFMCHGWTMDINGSEAIAEQTLPAGGLTVNVNIAVDTDNKYQYLYYSPGPNGKPYRIPAITTTANGYVFAINDYRPCGNDIGYGEVDLVMRHSTAAGSEWDGHSWTEPVTIADGLGHTNDGIWKLGFGDPAIVADRESNQVLVMSVCGNRTCWDGNYGAGTDENPENPNRVARLYITFNESTQQWVVGEPEEVTYDLYPLFKDSEGTVHSSSMFIGAGRIAQSSKIKVGTHYRIYCAVWTVTMTNRQHHNYAIYSDDFGKTWNLLGELGYDNCPSKWGNEPKCEELPDGSVLLSSRKYNGRYFNVFRYTDAAKGEGSWVGEVSTNDVGDLAWGGNSTNGEPLRVGNVLFQSAPTGSDRSDVSIFYKILSNDAADYTPTKLSSGWTEIEISDESSAYSSMALLPDNETLAIYYEEAPGGYSMVYLPLKLKDILPANVYDAISALPPTYASEASPVWHNIKFSASGDVLSDQGAGNDAATATAEETDACMWNIVGTKEGFYLVSKLGNYLAYDAASNRYKTTATKSEKVILTLKENIKGSWEIMRKGANKSMCQVGTRSVTGVVADGNMLGEANQVVFLDLTPETYEPAIFSTEAEPVWYQVIFQNGKWALTDQGSEQNALTAASDSDADTQKWQFIGTPESFYMKSKSGYWLGHKSSFYYSTTEANKVKLSLFKTSNSNYTGSYEIQRVGASNCMNMFQGAAAGHKISDWNAGDGGNPVQFVETPAFFSTEEAPSYWWVEFFTGNALLEDKGAGNNAMTATKSYTDSKLWALIGGAGEFKMKSKSGNYLSWNGSRFATSASASDAATLILHNNSNAGCYEIQLSGSTYMNQNGGAGAGKELGVWNKGDVNNPVMFVVPEKDAVIPAEFSIAASSAAAPAEKLTVWYTQPATATGVANTWMEYSLPIGNGQFGGSLFGGVARDEILFNDKTLWSGGPNEYGYYLPFGSVYIDDISGKFTTDDSKQVKNYYRDLNLATATGTVTYEDNDGVKYTRQYIASNPDKAIVTKITASEAGKLSFHITMVSGKPTVNAKTTYANGYAQFTGKLQTVSYNATLKVIAKGGITSSGADGITIEEADEVLLVLVGSTDFVGNIASHVNGNAANLPADNMAQADAVAQRGWDAVYADHVADHQKYFNRVTLEIDGVQNNLPTNELITAYNAASGTRNHMLEQLYYNYGRYLSIASSRGADSPANLQGIWNNTCTPPWHSDIHANINVQMNYWPVEAGNLSEMHIPFVNYIINEAAQPEWKGIAQNKGATRDDSWTLLTENNIFGGVSTFAPDALINNAWYVTHLWQHYRYTLDNEYLAKAFPAMKGASLFWVDRMVLAEDGKYECPNEYSPEHGPGQENATAHAQQIVWECIDNTIKAADKLNAISAGLISQEDYNLLINRRENMDRGLAIEQYEAYGNWPAERNGIKTGDNILREWKYSRFYVSGDQGHRHMSHLMALYPFSQLTPASEFFEPAINSMKLRGDESTGWSMGWKINLWARALMGDRSHAILRKALKHSTSYGTDQSQGGIYYNLFDSHAPFQIDGNFGACSGINEMLLQSHTEVIDILPALPTEWSKGYVTGLKAVGDFTVSIKWEGNQARLVTITNNQGQPCYVKCNGLENATVTVNGAPTAIGEAKTVNGLECYQIASVAGDEIVIDLSNATQADKSALEALIAQTENLVNECFDYYAAEAALTTTEGNDYYVSTNAQEDSEGPIANLVDGNVENHFHSEYTTDMGANHYINIDLGSSNAISSFRFKYATRKAETNFPATIVISGSTNGSDFTDIETVTNLPVGNARETKYYLSNIIDCNTAYTHLRFTVTANNSGYKEAGSHPYFHMAEFDLMPRTAEPVNNYPDAVNVPAAATNAKAAIATANEALAKTQSAGEYEASLKALQTAHDELVAAIASGSSPVLLTTDANNPIVYKIGIKRSDASVLQYDLASKMVGVTNYSEGDNAQGWYFTAGSADGKIFIHPYIGGGDVLAASSTSNAPATVWSAVKGTEAHEEWKITVVNSDNGTYNIKAGDDSNYFSNNGGTTNKMGFWSGDPSTDTGSLFTFTRINLDGGIWHNTLVAYNNYATAESYPEGDALGYYSNGAAYTAAKAAAMATLANEYAGESDYKQAYTELRAGNEAVVFNTPQAGHYYKLKGKASGKYIDASGVTDSRINMKSAADSNAAGVVFYLTEGNKLLSYYTGTTLVNTFGIGGTIADGNAIYFNPSEGGNVGCFTLKTNYSGSKYIYDNGGNGYIDRNGAYAANNCDWTIEEVTELPVIASAAGYATFYAPVETTISDGVEAYYINEVEGDLAKLTLIEDGVIPAGTGVIFKGEGTYNLAIDHDGTAESIENNMLTGTIERTLITKESNNAYYILDVVDDVVGMYNPVNSDDANKFYNAGHKAYMVVEGAAQTAGYSFSFDWGGTTSIDGVEAEGNAATAIYDLQGRKVNEITTPGYYIINGKLVGVTPENAK